MEGSAMQSFLMQAMYLVPLVLVGVIGLSALLSSALPKKAKALAVGGLGLVLVIGVVNAAVYALVVQWASDGAMNMPMLLGAVRLVTTLGHAIGLGLLVAAVLADRAAKPDA